MRMRKNKSGISMPINVNVRYDATLQKITGCREEPIMMSEDITFLPGTLGFDINGIPPKTYTSLVGGDIVNFSVPASFK